jgi:DNA repair protein RadA/Sms
MSKVKKVWSCSECGHEQTKWTGQCIKCSEWNSFFEQVAMPKGGDRYGKQRNKAIALHAVPEQEFPRVSTRLSEFDRLLGGGVVKGSLTLVGGDPGIGKSTLLMQVSHQIATQGLVVLYVCGEESVAQTSLRAKRLGVQSENILLLSETNFSVIKEQVLEHKPDLLIIDSIQIIYKEEIPSAPGSVVQVRETAAELMHIAKGHDISTFIIGHVTKSGEIAGPRILEHIVDTVLYFEGEKRSHYRMLRSIKNRFGSTDEVAVFQMGGGGLSEVENPSQIFLEERMKDSSGSVIFPTLEGSRPILIEVQALVTQTVFSTPSRRVQGFDSNRLALLLAVLEKRLGYQLHNKDVFVSIAGGIRITEPGVDLSAIVAISSSLINAPIESQTVVIGEVGLGGEVRSVQRIESRLREAHLMGFKRAVMPKRDIDGLTLDGIEDLQLKGVERVEEAINAALN